MNESIIISYTETSDESKRALESGSTLVMTANLEDMTDPSKTIYCVTGADITSSRVEAIKSGYLNKNGEPLSVAMNKYPIAINTEAYRDNFSKRLRFLSVHTKFPYGIHIGGSENMIEHSTPRPNVISKGLWCHGFKKTHDKDPDTSMIQFQADVWEDEVNSMIEKVDYIFGELEMVTTAFKSTTSYISKKGVSTLSNGEEIWYILKRLSVVHKNWKNIFFNIFQKESSIEIVSDKLLNTKAHISSYGLKTRMIAACLGPEEISGRSKKRNIMPRETKSAGTPFHASMADCSGGLLIDARNRIKTADLLDSIRQIKKLPI